MKTYFIIIFALLFFSERVAAQKPDINTLNKTSSTLGEVVTISGNGFSSTATNNIVYFGSAKASVVSATNSTLEVLVPPGATYDQISITNSTSGLTGFSSDKYLLSFYGKENINKDKLSEKTYIQEEDGLFDICVCDFNGDNRNDIFTTNSTNQSTPITGFFNTTTESQSNITFNRYDNNNFLIGEQTRNIACGDLDGDGKKDLVVGKSGNIADRLYLFRNTSTSQSAVNFAPVYTLSINIASTQASSRRIKVFDLDNDGKPEIIMTDQRNSFVHIFKNNSTPGNLNFSRDARVLLKSNRITLGLDIADINRDGKADVVFGSNLGADVYVAINRSNNGTLIFDEPVRIPVSGELVNLATGDFDLDGDMDIVVANFVNNVYVLLNQSTANSVSFSSPLLFETELLPYGVDVGDINGDGKIDIAVATNESTAPMTILENRSTPGNLSLAAISVGANEYQRNIKIADFSGDGKPDIAYTVDGLNRVNVLRNQHCVSAQLEPEIPNPICAGQPSELNATKALKVNYQWTSVDAAVDLANTEFTYEAIAPGDYQVTISSQADGCASTSNTVTVILGGSILPPTPTITGPDAVCEGGTLTLSSSIVSGVGYSWLTPDGNTYVGPTLQVNNVAGKDAGKYSLILEADGCKTDPVSKNIDISIVPNLEITATQGTQFCEGTQNVLSVGDLDGGSYTWYQDGQALTGSTTNQIATSNTGSYYVKFTNSYSCSNTSNTYSISQVSAPVASFVVPETVCLNETVLLTNTSTVSTEVNPVYVWDFGNENLSEEFEPSRVYNTPGTYLVALTVSYGNQYCRDRMEKMITVAETQGIAILINDEAKTSSDIDLCDFDTVKLSVDPNLTNIQWSTGSTDPEIFAYREGEYSVTATLGGNVCNSSDQIFVSILPGVNVEILTSNGRVKKGESIQLESTGAEQYEWTPEETLNNPIISNPIASPSITTVYTVTGYNSYNCSDEDHVEIIVEGDRTIKVNAQPVFTPNADGVHDLWVIDNSDAFSGCPIVIMNRNGQTVFESATYNNDWDATYNGKDLPEETYYFVIQCSSNEVHTGSITVMR